MFSGVWYSLRFSPRAKASISLLILSIVGGGGGDVGQKFSPFFQFSSAFWSRSVSDWVSWISDKFTIRLFKISFVLYDPLLLVILQFPLVVVLFRSKVRLSVNLFRRNLKFSLCFWICWVGAVLKNVVPVQNTSVVVEMKRNQVVNLIINYRYLFPHLMNKTGTKKEAKSKTAKLVPTPPKPKPQIIRNPMSLKDLAFAARPTPKPAPRKSKIIPKPTPRKSKSAPPKGFKSAPKPIISDKALADGSKRHTVEPHENHIWILILSS